MGDKWNEKSNEIYAIDQKQNSLLTGLANMGVGAEAITDVLLTHLHFDHTGGSTIKRNGTVEPTFPNATYYVQKSNFDWALEPTERDSGSYLRENFEPLARAGVLKVIDDSVEQLDQEIEVMRFNGHTRGQQLFKLSDGTTTLFYCGDLLPTTSHIPLPYIMGYDLQPLITLQEKKYILETGLEENWLLFFEHDPATACAKLKAGEKGIITAELYARLPE
jgi:glyoxylase-like metal-dependent hydrolase (beta-lactamase superfamily II)